MEVVFCEDMESKSRTGMPSSLAFMTWDYPLSSHTQTWTQNGVAISAEQRSKSSEDAEMEQDFKQ